MEQLLKNFTLEFFGKGRHKTTPDQFFGMDKGFLLDVRSKEESESISIKMKCHPNIECLNIPINEIPDRMDEIPKDKPVAVFCPANVRSAIVYAYLLLNEFSDVRIVEGGYGALTEALKPGKVLKMVQKHGENNN